jgi:tetratricopeptide (TPR) repeat protein
MRSLALWALLAIVLPSAAETAQNPDSDSNRPQSARDLYNAGTASLREGKFQEAQDLLQAAAASNNKTVVPSAVFNLAHARYDAGDQELRRMPGSSQLGDISRRARSNAQAAAQSVQEALAHGDVEALVQAYLRGVGARKDLSAATRAVTASLAQFGRILSSWERASADFRGVNELQPADTNASFNADIVDRRIAELVNFIRMQQQMLMSCSQADSDLKDGMKQIRKRLPKGKLDQLGESEGDDGQEPDEQVITGSQTARSQDQELISREEAAQLLRGIQLDSQRTLPITDAKGPKPAKRKGGDW